MKNTNINSYVLIFLLSIAIIIFPRYELFFSNALILDDARLIGDRIIGNYFQPKSLKELIYNFIVNIGGIVGGRLFICAGIAAAAVVVYRVIIKCGLGYIYAGAAVLLGLAVPASADDYIFVTGAHGLRAVIPAAFALACLYSYSEGSRWNRGLWKALLASLLFWLATHFSPLGTLAGLSGLVFAIGPLSGERRPATAVVVGGASIGPVLIGVYTRVFSDAKSHYLDAAGFMDMSLQGMLLRALENLLGFFGQIFSASSQVYFAGLVIAMITALLFWRMARAGQASPIDRGRRHVWVFPLALVLTGALGYAPTTTLTHFSPRYYEFAAVFTVWGVASLALLLLSRHEIGRNFAPLVCAVFIALGVIFSLKANELTEKTYGASHLLFEELDKRLPREAQEWPFHSQVIVTVDRAYTYKLFGYNHWSTSRLRVHSQRPDIIGLIGDQREMNKDPFVSRWRPTGNEYRYIDSAGRSSRAKMKGLEADRATFVYHYDPEAGLRRMKGLYIERGEQGARFIPFGDRPEQHPLKAGAISCEAAPDNVTSLEGWATYRIAENDKDPVAIPEAADRTFGGDEVTVFNMDPGYIQSFNLTLELVSGEEGLERGGGYGESYPPMPLLWRPLRIQQWEEGVLDIGLGEQTIDVPAPTGQRVPIQFSGEKGCQLTLKADGQTIRILTEDWLQNPLQLGKGFKSRFWKGRIENLTLQATTIDGETLTYSFDNPPE